MSTDETPTPGPDEAAPTPPPVVLRVVRGEPNAEEIAALVTVFVAMSGGGTDEGHVAPEVWSSPERLHRPPVFPGDSHTWWVSGLPR